MMLSRAEALQKWRGMTIEQKVALWNASGVKFRYGVFAASSSLIQRAMNEAKK